MEVTMKQYYYLVEDIDNVEHICDDLHKVGVEDNQIHIVGGNADEIESHHLHQAREIDETDIARFSERGALLGIILGLLFLVAAIQYQPFGIEVEGVAAAMITILIIGFCTWWGGIFGAYFINYRIAPFKRAVRGNKFLIMLDVPGNLSDIIRDMMRRTHAEAKWLGQNSTIANPFHSPVSSKQG
jgi:hypothetical protein